MAKKKRNNKKGKCKASRKTAVGQKKQQNQDEDEAIKEEREQHDELLARTMPQTEAAWQRILSRSPDAADGGRDKTDEETEAEKMEVKKFSIEMLQTLLQMLNIGILEKELTEEEKKREARKLKLAASREKRKHEEEEKERGSESAGSEPTAAPKLQMPLQLRWRPSSAVLSTSDFAPASPMRLTVSVSSA